MSGNWLYFAGTCIQFVAFTRGCDVGFIGLSLAVYGVGVFLAHAAGYVR